MMLEKAQHAAAAMAAISKTGMVLLQEQKIIQIANVQLDIDYPLEGKHNKYSVTHDYKIAVGVNRVRIRTDSGNYRE